MKIRTQNKKHYFLPAVTLALTAIIGVIGWIIQPLPTARAAQQSYVVTTAADAGVGSLRQAILDSNANTTTPSAPHQISFNIPGSGVQTISIASQLPRINQPTIIDGTTQPGSSCGTLVPDLPATTNTPHTLNIQLTGRTMAGANDELLFFNDTSDSSVVKGLVLNGAQNTVTMQADASRLECSYIGTEPDGLTATSYPNDTIFGSAGVSIAGQNSLVTNSLISGKQYYGLSVSHSGGARIFRNLIGTDRTGQALLNNQVAGSPLTNQGISVQPDNTDLDIYENVIGGTSSPIFSQYGASQNVSGLKIRANHLGVSMSGTTSLKDGISWFAGDTVVGGADPADRNIIAEGVRVNNSQGIRMQGNTIGLQTDGVSKLFNADDIYLAIWLFGDINRATIGGGNPGEGNIIHSGTVGIFDDAGGTCDNLVIQGNHIGVTPGGDDLGTGAIGIKLDGCNNTEALNANAPGKGNVIANQDNAIEIAGMANAVIQGQSVRKSQLGVKLSGNSNGINIHHNSMSALRPGGMSIQLGAGPNDPQDPDTGPNNLQNFPVAASMTKCDAGTESNTRLNSTPNTAFVIDYYQNQNPTAGNTQESDEWLSSQTVTTDGNGDASITVPIGQNITMTATDPSGNTSQIGSKSQIVFSDCAMNVVTNNPSGGALNGSWKIEGVTNPQLTLAIRVNGQEYSTNNGDGYGYSDGFYAYGDGFAQPLADGVYDVEATVTDQATGLSFIHIFTDGLTVDTVPPPVPTVESQVTNSITPVIHGTAPNAVDLYVAVCDLSIGECYYGVDIERGSDPAVGSWSLATSTLTRYNPDTGESEPVTLTPGTYEIQVTAYDQAYNASVDVTTNELIIDTTAPTGAVNDASATTASPQLTGTVNDQTASVSVTVNGQTYEATNNGDGTWTLPQGTIDSITTADEYTVTATFTDQAGNSSTADGQLTVAVPPDAQDTEWVGGRPILRGVYDAANAQQLRIQVAGVWYVLGESPYLTTDGDSWTLDLSGLSEPLAVGEYTVTAELTTLDGAVLSDTARLLIIPETPVTVIANPANGPLANTGINIYKIVLVGLAMSLVASLVLVARWQALRRPTTSSR